MPPPQVLCGNFYQDRLDWLPDGAPPFYVSPVFHFGRDNLGVEAASASAEHFAGTPPVTDLQVVHCRVTVTAVTDDFKHGGPALLSSNKHCCSTQGNRLTAPCSSALEGHCSTDAAHTAIT